MSQIVPVLGEDGMKIAPPGDFFYQLLGEMCWIRGKLADHVVDHLVLSTGGVVLTTSPGTESSPQSSASYIIGHSMETSTELHGAP